MLAAFIPVWSTKESSLLIDESMKVSGDVYLYEVRMDAAPIGLFGQT